MAMKNIKDLLTQGTALPAAIEGRLPEGAPKVSTMLLDFAGMIPVVPDFPMELPDLPAPPELPALPELPGAPAGLRRRYVTGVEVRPLGRTPVVAGVTPIVQEIIPSPAVGVIPHIVTRRGM